jgi:hypothetical protein
MIVHSSRLSEPRTRVYQARTRRRLPRPNRRPKQQTGLPCGRETLGGLHPARRNIALQFRYFRDSLLRRSRSSIADEMREDHRRLEAASMSLRQVSKSRLQKIVPYTLKQNGARPLRTIRNALGTFAFSDLVASVARPGPWTGLAGKGYRKGGAVGQSRFTEYRQAAGAGAGPSFLWRLSYRP